MTATSLVTDREELLDQEPAPHLSYSHISRYLTCPEQYRLYYLEKLRPPIESAGMVFGALVHIALADLFRSGVDPKETFQREWQNLKKIELRYSNRDSWEGLKEKGEKLLEKFSLEGLPRIQKVLSVEWKFELSITSLPQPFIGIVDLTARVDGQMTIADFKTGASGFEDHEVVLSDQLTAYWLTPRHTKWRSAFLSRARSRAASGTLPKGMPGGWWNTWQRFGSLPGTSAYVSSTSGRENGARTAISCRSALGTKRRSGRRS